MELKLLRKNFSPESTKGDLFVDRKYICNTLEDTFREKIGMPVRFWKIQNKTCIPCGRYEVKYTYSNRFKKMMLEILNVEDFTGVRFHCGNDPQDTEGCVLTGYDKGVKDWINDSKKAYSIFIKLVDAALAHGEKVFINIVVNPSTVRVF